MSHHNTTFSRLLKLMLRHELDVPAIGLQERSGCCETAYRAEPLWLSS